METRLASTADIPVLADLHAESFGEAKWDASQIASSLALTTTYAAVAIESGVIRGFILCQLVQGEAEILTFCVAPSSRRTGIGKALLDAAIVYIRPKGAKRIFLEVAADNSAACRLYDKAGFRTIGKRKGYYARAAGAVDALLFAREL